MENPLWEIRDGSIEEHSLRLPLTLLGDFDTLADASAHKPPNGSRKLHANGFAPVGWGRQRRFTSGHRGLRFYRCAVLSTKLGGATARGLPSLELLFSKVAEWPITKAGESDEQDPDDPRCCLPYSVARRPHWRQSRFQVPRAVGSFPAPIRSRACAPQQ